MKATKRKLASLRILFYCLIEGLTEKSIHVEVRNRIIPSHNPRLSKYRILDDLRRL